MLLIIFFGAVPVIFIRFVIQERFSFGDTIVRFLMNAFHMSDREALMITHYLFLNNMEAITLVAIFIFLAILLKFTITWFTKYFDEVSAGWVDLLRNLMVKLHYHRNWILWKISLIR